MPRSNSRMFFLFGAWASLVACTDARVPTAPDGKWSAQESQALAQNPLRWIGDEHNRILAAGVAEAKRYGIRRWPKRAKCQWLAHLVLREAGSAEAHSAVAAYYRGRRFEGREFELATRRLGCTAADGGFYVGSSATRVVAPTTAARDVITENYQPGDVIDTTDYVEFSDEAAPYIGQLENALATSQGPSQLDAAVATIQAQATGIWDDSVVFAVASTLVSSAYFWQSEFGGSSTQGWVGDPPPMESVVQLDDSLRGHSSFAYFEDDEPFGLYQLKIVAVDVLGCATALLGAGVTGAARRITLVRVLAIIAKRLVPGAAPILCVGSGAAASLAAYLMS